MSKLIGQCINEQLTAERALALSAESLVGFEDIAVLNDLEPILLDTDLNINENDVSTDVLGVIADTAEIMESEANLTLPTRVAILESVESIAAIIGVERKDISLESITTTDDIQAYSEEGLKDVMERVMGVFNAGFIRSDKVIQDGFALRESHRERYLNILKNLKQVNFTKNINVSKDVLLPRCLDKGGNIITDYNVLVKTLQQNLDSLKKLNEVVSKTSKDVLDIINLNFDDADKISKMLEIFGKNFLGKLSGTNSFKVDNKNELKSVLVSDDFITGEHLKIEIPNLESNLVFKEKVRILQATRSDSFLTRMNKKTDRASRTSIFIDTDKHDLTQLNKLHKDYNNLYSDFINNDAFILKAQETPILSKATNVINIVDSVAKFLMIFCVYFNVSYLGIRGIMSILSKKALVTPELVMAVHEGNLRALNNGGLFMFGGDAVLLAAKGASFGVNYLLGLVNTLSNVKNKTLAVELSMCDFINYTIIQNMNIINNIYKQVK